MGLWDKIRGEFIDIVEWLDPSNDTMVYRFERHGNEIKQNAQLVVRESQAAVFINEGQLADVFAPGTHTLNTQNLPILSTLQGWKYGFESPFKAEVYFVSTRRFTNLKWGTQNPIMMRDAEFGPLRLRMFGTYCVRVADPAVFIKEIVGTDGQFTADEVSEQLRNLIVSRFSDMVAESKIPALDMAANYDEFGRFATERLHPDFVAYGLDVSNLLVENVSLPPAVEEALDKRTSMGVVGNLQQYAQFQAANAMEAAAKNPGGEAAGGIGLGMGFAMANQMVQNFGQGQAAPGGPPPLPNAAPAYFAAMGGQQTGPHTLEALQQQVQQGTLKPETLVWTQGMADWTAAAHAPALAPLFGAVPPPLPPS
ncbi:MAG: SPFH domain-containing protein [Candidatus Hydrogenedentes bacterium]|nr:SPFH domain-containing protein [Candidatus Hydrogenedentota bacterium]